MFGSRLFWKLYASYAAVVLVTAIVIGVLVHQKLRASLLAREEQFLKQQALLNEPQAQRDLAEGASPQLESQLQRIGREAGLRISLIREDGVVIGDSAHEPSSLENHSDRPELRDARDGEFGVSQRHSATVQEDLLYVARAVRSGGNVVGFLRISIPLTRVNARVNEARVWVAEGAAVAVALALLLGLVVARRITRPLVDMTRVADAMRSGEYGDRVRELPRDEIGVLGGTLNQLGIEVTQKIAAISQEQAQLRAMLSGMVEGVIAVDEEEHVLFCNRAACELLGVDDLDVPGKRVWETARLAGLVELLTQARARGEAVQTEMTVRKLDREIVLEAHATPFRGANARGLVAVLHDITNLRRLERIRRDFVANVSHELKTPLTAIKGFVETLLSGAMHDEKINVRFLKKIDDNAIRLTNLVQDLLSLARIEAHEGVLPLAPVDLSMIVDAALRRHDVVIRQKGLTSSLELSAGPLVVEGDAEAVTQILDNLLDNAVKYTPAPGAIAVRLSRSNGRVQLDVSDSGIGIPEKDLERVFERFYRVDKARSRELGGTGLGLSIVKHLVSAMRGEVRVESQLGQGSRFTVLLPLAPG